MDNENIKEILEYLKCEEEYYDGIEEVVLSSDEKVIERDDIKLLLDYITNLQEELDISQTNEGTYRLEMLDITKILGLDEHTTFDEVKEYATNLQEENEYSDYCNKKLREKITNLEYKITTLEDYKTRNEKAIEYIEKGNKHFKENYNEPYEYAFMVNADEIMKILKGKSDE